MRLKFVLPLLFLVPVPGQSAIPSMPGNTGAPTHVGFTPLAGYPSSTGSGWPTATCPVERCSGIFGFTDTRGTSNPNDDEEYMLVGKSDGMLLVRTTPVIPAGQGVTNATIPQGRTYSWLEDGGWGYLGPANGQVPPPAIRSWAKPRATVFPKRGSWWCVSVVLRRACHS